MKLSVVMSVHNKAHYMDAFLLLLRRNTPDAEFILIDDGSTDGTGDILKRHADIFIRTEDIWEVKANNVGLRAASGDYVAIVQDDDLVISDHWLPKCVDLMNDKGIGILGGRGIGHFYFRYGKEQVLDGTMQLRKYGDFDVYLRLLQVWSFPEFNVGKLKISPSPVENSNGSRRSPVFFVDGTYRSPYILTRDTINKVGYFDESYAPLGYDDHDYCMRAQLCGIKSAVTSIEVATRFQGGSGWLYNNNQEGDFMAASFRKNEEILFTTHKDNFKPLPPNFIEMVGELGFVRNTSL